MPRGMTSGFKKPARNRPKRRCPLEARKLFNRVGDSGGNLKNCRKFTTSRQCGRIMVHLPVDGFPILQYLPDLLGPWCTQALPFNNMKWNSRDICPSFCSISWYQNSHFSLTVGGGGGRTWGQIDNDRGNTLVNSAAPRSEERPH